MVDATIELFQSAAPRMTGLGSSKVGESKILVNVMK